MITSEIETASIADAGDEHADPERYRLISISAVRAPEGCTGRDWHLYRIAQGENGITGYRCGDLAHVKAEVETIVAGLNGRRQASKNKEPPKSQRRTAVGVSSEAANRDAAGAPGHSSDSSAAR